jgi:outer membrane autotransporter protein
MRVRAVLLATTTAVLSLSGTAAAQELVSNGDFESGLAGWSCFGGESCGTAVGGNPGSAFSGYDDFGSGTVSQTLVTTPGIYAIQYDFRDDASSGSSLQMQFGSNAPVGVSLTTSYQTDAQVLATNTANTDIAFIYATTCCTSVVRVDNVSVMLVDDGLGNNIGAAAQTVAAQSSRDFLDRLQSRFDHAGSPIQKANVREVVLASAGGTGYVNAGGKYRAFMNVFGSHGEWGSNAMEADRRGVSAGIETAAGSGLDVGAAFSFSRSDFDTKTAATTNSGDAYEYLGALYAHWSATPNLFVNAVVGYGSSSSDLSRVSLLGFGSAGANDVSSDQWFGSVEAGWDFAVNGGTLTPYVRLDGAMIEQDGYTEVTTGLLVPAVVAGRDFDALRSIVGLRATTNIPSVGRYGATLGGKVGWAHEFEQDRFVAFSQTTGLVTFAGTSSAGVPAQDSVVAGANFEFSIGGGSSIYAGYDGNFGGNQTVHAGEAGVRITW